MSLIPPVIRPFAILTSWLLWGVVCASVTTSRGAPQEEVIDLPPELPAPAKPPPPDPEVGSIYVAEYRVRGAKILNGQEIGAAVYPYLGPARTEAHIEAARGALEKAYHDKGYQTVSVSVPQQSGARGIIFLDVEEIKIGKLRVKGARYFIPGDIRRRIKSLSPGTVPNFTEVTKDLVKLNRSADLAVTSSLDAGGEPGTMDVTLTVKDKFPLHASVELNNRYSENTVPLRLNSSINYSNLWNFGHSVGFSYQVAPEDPDDASVYSAFYNLPVADDVSLMFTGTKQDSSVSTLGGAAVNGRGEILGLRANVTLPTQENTFFHTLSAGLDYKHFDEDVAFAGTATSTPIDYYPMTVAYYFSSRKDKHFTEGNLSANWHVRGMGSELIKFDDKRYNADGAYIYFRGDLAHTHDLPYGFQVMAKLQGQYSHYPLINTEQYSGGGLGNVRGYLESAALGDYGWFGTLELRSPPLIPKRKPKPGADQTEEDKAKAEENSKQNEWRIYGFVDGGRLFLNQPLPEQQDEFILSSLGVGTSLRLWNHVSGSIDAAMPMDTVGTTEEGEWFVSFRVSTEF